MDTTTAPAAPTSGTATTRTATGHRLRSAAGFLAGNWPARLYLTLVAGTVVYAALAGSLGDQPDAGLAGVWPFLAAAPGSLVLIGLVPESGPRAGVGLLAVLVAGVLINTAIISALVHVTLDQDAGLPARPQKTFDAHPIGQ